MVIHALLPFHELLVHRDASALEITQEVVLEALELLRDVIVCTRLEVLDTGFELLHLVADSVHDFAGLTSVFLATFLELATEGGKVFLDPLLGSGHGLAEHALEIIEVGVDLFELVEAIGNLLLVIGEAVFHLAEHSLLDAFGRAGELLGELAFDLCNFTLELRPARTELPAKAL